MWFFSGVVMMYVGYPKLTPWERLGALPELDPSDCCVDLDRVIAVAGGNERTMSVRLTTVAGAPRFVATFEKKRRAAIDARTGVAIVRITPTAAIASATAFSHGATGEYDGAIDEDAWTHSRALDGDRPLHRIWMSDAEQTLLYVSGTTGEVVRDANRTERIWNWVGTWIHWLYMFRGGAFDASYKEIMTYLPLAATLLAITGLVVGLLRWRFRGVYKSGSKSPYREPFARWHHLCGLVFGLVSTTWVFSGSMSANPWRIFDSPVRMNGDAYSGAQLSASLFSLDAARAIEIFRAAGFRPRELEWRALDGAGYYIAYDGSGATRALEGQAGATPFVLFPLEQLQRAAARLLDAPVKETTFLTSYDSYYYSRAPHTMTGESVKRLPVLRVAFDDLQQSLIHIDPYTSAPIDKLDERRRMRRWLFAFLHSFDWPPLLAARPAWDVLLIFLSLGGFGLSITGIVLGRRRVSRKRTQLFR
jgi:hypothetical protein